MKKRVITCGVILIIVVVVIGIIAVRSNNRTEDNGNVLIKMNEVTRSVFYAPQYVAINNGYFKDYGIEVDLTTGQRCRCSNDISVIR